MSARSLSTLATSSLAAAALLATLSGCGGSDAPSTPSSAAPSSAATTAATSDSAAPAASDDEFVASANAVCEADYPAINAFLKTLDPENLDADAVASGFVPLVTALQSDLSALTPPDDLADQWNQVISDQQAQVDQVTSDPASLADIAAGAGDTVNSEFDAIGVTSCGSDSGSF